MEADGNISRTVRICSLAGLGGATIFLLSLIWQHLELPSFDWLGEYASDLANRPSGWLFALGMFAHGLGNLALAQALRLTLDPGRLRKWGVGLFSLAAAAMILTALFPTEPSGAVASLVGMMHRAAASLAFFAELAAFYVFGIAFQSSRSWRSHHRTSLFLAVLSTLSLMVFVIANQLDIAPGLAERIALASFIGWELWAIYHLLTAD